MALWIPELSAVQVVELPVAWAVTEMGQSVCGDNKARVDPSCGRLSGISCDHCGPGAGIISSVGWVDIRDTTVVGTVCSTGVY